MIADFATLASKAKENFTTLFMLLGDAGVPERSHRFCECNNSSQASQKSQPSTTCTPQKNTQTLPNTPTRTHR